jgi:hypothetical protein
MIREDRKLSPLTLEGDPGVQEEGGVFQRNRRILSIYVLFTLDCHLGPTGQRL